MNLPRHKPIFAYTTDGGETFVEIGEAQEIQFQPSDYNITEIGEVSMVQQSPVSLTVTTTMNHYAIIKFAMDVLSVTNNMIRYHGGKALRLRQIRKWDK